MLRDAGFLPREARDALATASFGRRLYFLHEVDSTNRVAKQLAAEGEREGTVVLADFQTAGRGRRDRRWESPRGRDLLFSVILRPRKRASEILPLTLVLSLAVAETLSDELGVEVGVKWPNDVVSPRGKVCGVLCDTSTRAERVETAIAGFGLNVNQRSDEFPRDLAKPAASCYTLTDEEHPRGPLLARILAALETAYGDFIRHGFENCKPRYVAKLSMMGSPVAFDRRGRRLEGDVVDVQVDGALTIKVHGREAVNLYDDEITPT